MRRLGSGNVQKELNEDKELERQRALSKSKRMLLERDDKIKKLNKAIDQAQCFAARDKQVLYLSSLIPIWSSKNFFGDIVLVIRVF